ncbi:MAG: hypothetical protein IBJ14_04910 [Hydrogenophaga sp.]|nr:hypothetical protein [Hydrogenophaga sp.]
MVSLRPSSATPEVAFPTLQMPKLEMCFHDGSRLWLKQATNDPLQRHVHHQGEVLRVDLRRLIPGLEEEFCKAAPLDRPAVIFFLARKAFKSDAAFLAAVTGLHPRKEAAHA